MKKLIFCTALAMVSLLNVSADERDVKRNHPSRRMAPPVYAASGEHKRIAIEEMTPEQRARFNAHRKRRFEIMMLIGAYKIMPENERQPLRNELLKRIREDFHANIAMQKERIAQAEADLKKLRSEVAEREANSSKLVERELDRLLKAKFTPRGGKRPGRADKK